MPSEREETTVDEAAAHDAAVHEAAVHEAAVDETAVAGEETGHDTTTDAGTTADEGADDASGEGTSNHRTPATPHGTDSTGSSTSESAPAHAAADGSATAPQSDDPGRHQADQPTSQAKRPREATKFFMPVSPTEVANAQQQPSRTPSTGTPAPRTQATNTPAPRTPAARTTAQHPSGDRTTASHRHKPHLPRRKPATPKPPPREETTYGPALLGESTVQLVLDLALRIGEVQMSSGAGASDATATILAVANAYGLPHCEVDVIFTSITVTVHRGVDITPITAVRLVRTRGQDYTRLTDVERLVRKITAGKIRVHEASAQLDSITSAPHPYARWTATVAWAGTAASIAILIGGDWLLASIAAIITAAIDRVGRYLNRRSLPAFFQQLVGGLLATFLALALVHSNIFAGLNNTSLVVGAAITVLLSGLSVVSTVQDAITGYNVTAAGRTMEITLISAGLIAGVVIGLKLASVAGIADGANLEPAPTSALRLPLLTVAGAAAAGFFALASYASVRGLLVSSAAGAGGAIVYGTLSLLHAGPIASSGIAAVVIGFAGGLLARRLRIPPVIVAVAGLTPLLPGLSTYRALYQLSVVGQPGHNVNQGLTSLVVAVTIALALGAGVVLGEYLAQPVRTSMGKLERRFTGPRMAGPLNPTHRRIE